MALLKTINGTGKYRNEDAKQILVEYAFNHAKMVHGLYGGIGVSPECPAESMQLVSELFGKQNGVQLRHFVISFAPYETHNPVVVNEIACKITRFIGEEYQAVFAVHEDIQGPLHIHIIMNSVSYIDGHRYYGTRHEFFELRNVLKQILQEYGIGKLQYCYVGQ